MVEGQTRLLLGVAGSGDKPSCHDPILFIYRVSNPVFVLAQIVFSSNENGCTSFLFKDNIREFGRMCSSSELLNSLRHVKTMLLCGWNRIFADDMV